MSNSNVLSPITDAISSITGLLSNGNSILGEGVSSISDAFSGTVSSIFNDTFNSDKSNINTPVPDSIKANLSKGTPRSGIFTTNNLLGQSIVPSNVRNLVNEASPSVISQRYNATRATSTNSLYGEITSAFKNSAIGSVFADTKNIIGKTVAPVTQGASEAFSQINQIRNEYTQLTSGLANAFGQNINFLQDTLDNALLPSRTLVNDQESSILGQSSATSITSLLKTASSVGCEIKGINTDAYRAKQSLYNTLLGFASNLNMPPILDRLLECSRFDDSSIGITRDLFKSNLNQRLGVSSSLYGKLDNTDVFLSDDEVKDAYTHANPEDGADMEKIMSKAKMEIDHPLKSYSDNAASSTYDLDVLSGTDDQFLSSVFPTSEDLTPFKVLNDYH